MKLISVVGTRPNFMKVAPLHKEFLKHKDKISHLICHTGQHYDEKMSKVFFDELELPEPDFYLGVGSGSHTEQTAKVMIEFEKVLLAEKPDLIIVVGDVNSTIACSLVAVKMGVKIAHVEAGLRSFDRAMPEEINRILTDAISDYLFVTEKSGIENLKREGVPEDKIHFVGNVMIDSLVHYMPKAEKSKILEDYKLKKGKYILVTMHRPSNVDAEVGLAGILSLLNCLAKERRILFPIHPRTKRNLEKFNMIARFGLSENLVLTDPIGYIDFLCLTKNAELVITDSGGIQEETTYLGVQCITLRNNTERPITVEVGTNHLIGVELNKVKEAAFKILDGNIKLGYVPELWEGMAAERICKIIPYNTLNEGIRK